MIASFVERLSRPTTLVAFARWGFAFALRANCITCARLWNLAWRLTKTDRRKTHTSLVLRWPTRRTLLAWSVYWLLPWFAKVKLGETFTSFVWCILKAASRPARIITFAGWLRAIRTQALATAVRGQLLGRGHSEQANNDPNTHGDYW